MNLYAKLLKIQTTLKAPKGRRNNFGNYSYRSAEDILMAVKPLLAEHGVLLLLTDEIRVTGDRYYVAAMARAIDTETGEELYAQGMAREADSKKGMDDAQVTGSASSYARKYALNGLFAIDESESDPDANEGQLVTEATKDKLYSTAKKLGVSAQRMKAILRYIYKKEASQELTELEARDLIANLVVYSEEIHE